MIADRHPHFSLRHFALFALFALFAGSIAAAAEVRQVVPPTVQPFALGDVKLLDGPFKHAEAMNHKYLLSLDPDRLLHTFRLQAGLPSTAKPLGGWEEPKCELRGHFAGHYLTACALTWAATGDPKIREKADYLVAEMAKCQAKMGTGYLSAYPEEFIDRVVAGKPVWAPWYTIHKIYAGLLDMHTLAGNREALEVLKKAADWVKTRTDKLSDAEMEKMLGNEHGGMNDVLADLAAVTGEEKYLRLAQRFNHHAVLDPLSRREDKLTGLHANTQFPKVLGAQRQYELTGDPKLRTIGEFFWDVVTKERSYVTGGNSDGEHFSPKEHLSKHLGPSTTETCNTYNMLKITRRLFTWDPRCVYADYYERALLNHILPSQDPATGMVLYYMPLKSGVARTYCTPTDSFWCCCGTGIENHAKYGDSIYFHDGQKALYLNLFIASVLDWKDLGLSLRQETTYPQSDSTRLTFTCAKPVELTLQLRHPYWATSGIEISVNGQRQTSESKPGSFVALSRQWQTGDTVEMRLPMGLRTEGFRDNPSRLAVMYGPLVLCAPVEPGKPFPVIVSPIDKIPAAIEPAGRPLCFRGSPSAFRNGQTGEGVAVELEPFYQESKRPYVVYWDVLDEAQLKARREQLQAELAREKALEGRTLDRVLVGDGPSERAHGLKGEKTGAGEFQGRHWRHATDGGWFEYQLKVAPDKPVELLSTYWGSDTDRRVFDILIDGRKIATQKLDRNRPDQFYDEVYPIPVELTQGKDKVTVRFQAQPGMWAGGVFGCRVLSRK